MEPLTSVSLQNRIWEIFSGHEAFGSQRGEIKTLPKIYAFFRLNLDEVKNSF